MALAALLGALFTSDAARTASDHGVWFGVDVLVGVVACGMLPLRRRWPVWVAVLLIPSLMLSAAAMGATAVAVFSVALSRPHRVTAAVAGFHAVTVVSLFALATTDDREFWQGVVVVLALDAALIASGLLVRSQRLLVRSLRERAAEAEEGNRLRLEEARHLERERIAREMHDVLAHRISLLAVHAGALEVRRSAPEEERQAASVVRQCAYEALEDLREVIGMLRDEQSGAADHPQPTLTDIPALVEESRLAGADVTFDDQAGDPAGDGVGRHAYRVVQEGLTNARKHAPGARVRVRLDGSSGGLTVEVTNPLTEEAAARIPGAGAGLIGLGERMNLVGGRLEHGRTREDEFRLRAWLPWRA